MGQLDGDGVNGPQVLSAERGALHEVVRTRRPVVLNNVSENPRLEPHRAWLQSRGVKAVLLAPLVAGDNLLGVIGIHNTERDTWQPEQAELAQAQGRVFSLGYQRRHTALYRTIRREVQSGKWGAVRAVVSHNVENWQQTIGGTWRDATYPGAACDIPSLLYSYSFARNPRWSRAYSPSAEICAHLEELRNKH